MRVRLYSTLRSRSGRQEVAVDAPTGATVREVLRLLVAQAPDLAALLLDEAGELKQANVAFLNGRQTVFLQGPDTVVAAGDTLDLFPRSHQQRAFAAG